MLAIHILGSGSKGNCSIIEDCKTGHGVLVDAGICKRDVLGRARESGFDMECLDAILITHEHSDHTSKLGVVLRGIGKERLRMHVLPAVKRASSHIAAEASSLEIHDMRLGVAITEGGISIIPLETSHDAAGSCGFRFETPDGDSVGYITDTGLVTDSALEALRGVRILAIESNHDVRMLKEGPYPRYLQERILSKRGHLSNEQAAEAVSRLASPRLQHVVAMHLSENNNLPSAARKALQRALDEAGSRAEVHVASQRMLVSVR